jgi:catechol 2,3-dioxygenase-like lactoylglutathione lyase family enzyme
MTGKDVSKMQPEAKQHHPLPFLENGIAQVAIIVPDLDAAVRKYWEVFGIGPWQFYTYQRPLVQQMSYHGQPADHKNRIALSQFGPMRIELIEVLEGDSVYADFVREHGYGVQHLGILVEDMQAALAQAQEAGLEMTQDGSGFGLDGDGHYAYLNTEEDFGITFELIQRPLGRRLPEKVYPEPDGNASDA